MDTTNTELTANHLIKRFKLQGVQIIKPTAEQITPLCSINTTASPKSSIMSVKRLRLRRFSITPVHLHFKKEKMYHILEHPSNAIVFIHLDGFWQCFQLKFSTGPVIVPVGAPHALYTFDSSIIIVTTSSQDSGTEWEEGYK